MSSRGEYRDRSPERFDDYARSWIDTTGAARPAASASAPATITARRWSARRSRSSAPMPLSRIELRDMKEFARKLETEGLAPNTVRLAVAPVRALLATAVEEGLIRSNPAAGLRLAQRRPRATAAEEPVKALSEEELRDLLAAIARLAPEWLLFFEFLTFSGVRIGEAVELRWKDIDLGVRTVGVHRSFHRGQVGPPKSRYGTPDAEADPGARAGAVAVARRDEGGRG